MPVSSLWVLSGNGPMSTRLTSGDATDALNRSSRGELEGWIMGKNAREGVASHSSAHRQIAPGSTRARLDSDTSARIAMPMRLARHQLQERLDRPRRHTLLHLYHRSLRRAQATNTCCISSPSSPSAADNPLDPKRIGSQICGGSTSSPGSCDASSESQHRSSNPKVVEQNGPHHPSPDSPSGTWLQTERGRNEQHQG